MAPAPSTDRMCARPALRRRVGSRPLRRRPPGRSVGRRSGTETAHSAPSPTGCEESSGRSRGSGRRACVQRDVPARAPPSTERLIMWPGCHRPSGLAGLHEVGVRPVHRDEADPDAAAVSEVQRCGRADALPGAPVDGHGRVSGSHTPTLTRSPIELRSVAVLAVRDHRAMTIDPSRAVAEAATPAHPHERCRARTWLRFVGHGSEAIETIELRRLVAQVSDQRDVTRAGVDRARGGHESRPGSTPLAEREARE